MTITISLNLKYKMKVIEFCFPLIYGSDELDAQLEKIKNMFYDLFQEYTSPPQF